MDPEPGDVVHLDFRPKQEAAAVPARPLRLLQWNIERGYELGLVIQQLKGLDADIISLQEVDVGCERSGCKDTGAAIAEAMQLNYLFVCEFQEMHSPLRNARSQGGGVHGNAILSRYDFTGWSVLEHSHHPINWSAPPEQQQHPLAAKEPRKGRRLTLSADVATPHGCIRVYCCHLEVFCGVLARVSQFSDILLDVKQHQLRCQQHQHQDQQQPQSLEEQQSTSIEQRQLQQPQPPSYQQQQPSPDVQQQSGRWAYAILGDLNTMAHGIARLSPNYCRDAMRWLSLGCSEAAWWQRNVLSVTEPCKINSVLLQLGLPAAVAVAAVNPGFIDPFDVRTDYTLDNPAYRLGPLHLMRGKLDWALLRGCRVVGTAMGNDDFAASDHKWLLVDVNLLQGSI